MRASNLGLSAVLLVLFAHNGSAAVITYDFAGVGDLCTLVDEPASPGCWTQRGIQFQGTMTLDINESGPSGDDFQVRAVDSPWGAGAEAWDQNGWVAPSF